MTVQKFILILLFLLGFSLHGYTQNQNDDFSYFLPKEKFDYRADIPTPRQFFGFELNEQHLNNDQIVAYMQALAQKSPRMELEVVGYSYQQRPLVFLTVSAPENLQNLEKIRTEHLKLSNPALSGSCDTENMPVVLWLGYSVHGNECSGVNASAVVAYFLAAAEGPEIDNILKNSVILLHPALNPDGVNRYTTWVNANRSFTVVSDPNSREFREPLPSSRTNHYWFDLNRDWMLLQMTESRARMAFYHQWRPTMVNDYHEHDQNRSANYYFSPGEINQTHNLIPSTNWEVSKQISQYHARELDKIGTLYYSREHYDDFYPGKGSCFPDFHGAIGLLYEQPSSRGFFQERNDGLIRTFKAAIRNQAYCSYSAIRAGIDMRTQLLNYTRNAYKEAQQMAKSDPVQGYVFGSQQTRQIDYEFFKILKQHQIEVYRLGKPVKLKDRSFDPEYAYVIPSRQDGYRLLKVMMEKKTDFIDSAFYDVSTWTLPLAFNLYYSEINHVDGLLGERLSEFPAIQGVVTGKSDYAYLFNVHEFLSVKLIYHLQEAGIRLKVASKPFSIQIDGKEQTFDYGAVMLPVADQFCTPEQIYALLQQWAPKTGITVYPVFSGVAADSDLGGRHFRNLQLPKAAIIYGGGSFFSGVGDIWHLFDQRLQVPLTLLEYNRITANVLSRYNTIILYGNYDFDKVACDLLKAWHDAGGTMIVIGEGWKTVNKIGIATIEIRETAAKGTTSEQKPVYLPYSDRPNVVTPRIPGVILECRLDRSSPVRYGIVTSTIPSFRESVNFFKLPTPYSSPVSYLDKPLLSGCIAPNDLTLIANTPAVLTFPRLVYFADEPAYRAYWFGTMRLFVNAVFFPL